MASSRPPERRDMNTTTRRLCSAAASVLMLTGGLAAFEVSSAPAASADVGCYGDYCSGQNPDATKCAADAKTIAVDNIEGAMLEVRYSPTCQTNWARYQQYPLGLKIIGTAPLTLRAVQDTGYTQEYSFGINGADPGTYVTPMIYSPVHKVYAEVVFQCGGVSLLDTAFDCATNATERTAAV